MRALLTFSAAALVVFPSVAQAATPQLPCLTPAEFTSLANYALPSMINGARLRCTQTLPTNSYLRSQGSNLSARYAVGKSAAWPAAKATVVKMVGSSQPQANDLLRSLPDPTLQQMADAMVEGAISQNLPLERCEVVDRAVRLMSPLPAENVAELIAITVGLGAQAGRARVENTRLGAISICKASN